MLALPCWAVNVTVCLPALHTLVSSSLQIRLQRGHLVLRHHGAGAGIKGQLVSINSPQHYKECPSLTESLVFYRCRYDCSADIWSFGITVLELALGQAPLQNCNLDQILMKTLNEPAPVLESADRRKRFTAVHKLFIYYILISFIAQCLAQMRPRVCRSASLLLGQKVACQCCVPDSGSKDEL